MTNYRRVRVAAGIEQDTVRHEPHQSAMENKDNYDQQIPGIGIP
jgi:hypothetical protein